MRRPPPRNRTARLARGGISWVGMLLLILVVGGGYLAWTWGPVYILNYEVKQVVRDYINQAVHNPDDAQLLENMVHKLRTLDEIEVPGDDGRLARIPTVQVAATEVVWERDPRQPPTLHVLFDYTRPVAYPLLNRWTQRTLTVDITGDLTRPDWGPAR